MERLTGSSLLPELVTTRILRAGLSAAWDGSRTVPGDQRSDVAVTVVDLATSMFERLYEEYSVRGGRLLLRMKDYIKKHFADPTLDVEQLAREHHVSVRSVYEAFAEGGSTPSATIRLARVTHAADIYRRAAPAVPSATEVAIAAGFRDTTTFSRAFSAHYGLSPTAWARRSGR
jgi:AraC-like DNA-binding protein